jgi:VWFA-related protein
VLKEAYKMTASMAPLSISRSGVFRLAAVAALLLAAISHPALGQVTVVPDATTASSSQIETLKTTVRRVALDVVVTDSEGFPVAGLTQEDFKVEEDKVPQLVRSFDAHTATAAGSFTALKISALAPNTFFNLQTAPEVGTPTVILYDALNTSLAEQSYARQQLLQFIRHRRPGTQIAIFVLGTRLRLLQGFTDDIDLLSAALASKRAGTHAMALQGGGSVLMPTAGGMDGDPVFDKMLMDFALMDRLDQARLASGRRDITFKALAELGRFLTTVPGRKNLVWVSSAFQVNREAMDVLNLSDTAVYTVDVKGVRANPAFSAATTAAYGFDGIKFGFTPKTQAMQESGARVWMDWIADATGGHAFYGTNDLQGAVDRAMTDGSTYYSLTYEPTNPKYDGSLRHIKVTLKRPGYNLAYRRTYYADDLEAAARKVADAPQNPLTPSLERGTPLAHDLFIEAHLDADGAPTPATPEQMQVLAQFGDAETKKAKAKPAAPVLMQQYLISYGLVARQLEMPVDDKGAREVSLELGLISYDEDGRKLNGVDTHIDDPIPAANYAKLLSDGYQVVQSIAVPVTAASIRFAVRDIRGNRVGSLEVTLPLAKTAEARTADKMLAK